MMARIPRAPGATPSGENGGPLLAVEGLDAGYGAVQVLWSVSLSVARGEAVALIGSNGAGKTTLLRAISGTIPERSGRITFKGANITGLPPDRRVALGVAHVPEGRQLFAGMTVRENLRMGAYARRDGRAEVNADLERVFGVFPILAERKHQLAGTLSGGEQQMVAIGRALMTSPKLTLLDEPSLGLSPKFVSLIFEKLVEMKRAGYTLMVVEQNAARALAIADRGYVLELGRNRFEGAGQRLLADPEVKRLYLGG